jgi:hypothetical protein
MSAHVPAIARGPAFRLRGIWLTLAAVGWAGIGILVYLLASAVPPRAGFDLELLLVAGRRIAAGLSPYDPAGTGGNLAAQDLFYSYPPPLAQALALAASLPMPVALLLLALGSVGGLALVARLLARRLVPDRPGVDVALPAVALAPLVFPYAVAILFGNLDATFPLVYGLLLVAALSGTAGTAWAGGAALAIAAISKLHPASMWLWFVARPDRSARRVAGATVVIGLGIVVVSLLVGGLTPWLDYLGVVRTGAGADLVDRRNVGPAAQLTLLLGQPESFARVAQAAVSLSAVAFTILVARLRRDPVESLALAATVSLVTLPVTWFHYPVALIPFGIAAAVRADGTPAQRAVLTWLFAAGAVAALAIVFPVTVWFAVAFVLRAVVVSARLGHPAPAVASL